jgi:hypothetical protein
MRLNIHDEPCHVSLHVYGTFVDLHIASLNILPIRLVDVVLGADMNVSHRQQRKLRHRIIPVRYPVVPPRLIRDVCADLAASNARRAKVIKSYAVSCIS